MQVSPITPTGTAADAGGTRAVPQSATAAFGLGFDALLKIILTQLTYQDPLKPMDNFQFVSQLAQFSQIQLSQTGNDRLTSLLAVQAPLQAAALLGKTVDVGAGASLRSGTVIAVDLANGTPALTIETATKQTISGLALSDVRQVREGK